MNEKKTLQQLVEEGRRKIAAERAAADAWVAARPQREAQAVEEFRQYMSASAGVVLGDDTIVVADEVASYPNYARMNKYLARIILPALGYIATHYSDGLLPDGFWVATTLDGNISVHQDLTDALLWLTDGQPLPADLSEAGYAMLPEYAYAA